MIKSVHKFWLLMSRGEHYSLHLILISSDDESQQRELYTHETNRVISFHQLDAFVLISNGIVHSAFVNGMKICQTDRKQLQFIHSCGSRRNNASQGILQGQISAERMKSAFHHKGVFAIDSLTCGMNLPFSQC
jgi:hypothetical protein